jgi:predicted transcriptional regulator
MISPYTAFSMIIKNMKELTQEIIEKLLLDGYSQEDIASIQRGMHDIDTGNTMTEEQMKHFVEEELFAKYKVVNV